MKRSLLFLPLASALACGAPPPKEPATAPTATPATATTEATSPAEPAADPKPEAPMIDPATLSAVATGNNGFAADLYQKLREEKGNLIASPASVSTALAMTYAGAAGETATEMQKALKFPFEGEKLHSAYGAFLQELNSAGEKGGYQLSVANRLWGRVGAKFQDEFLAVTRDRYGAALEPTNFAEGEAARKTINTWVEEKTQQKIKDLIPPGLLDASTELVLTNAIYFKGKWQKPFKPEQTKDEPFFVSAKESVTAPMMRQRGRFKHVKGDGLSALELPYGDGSMAMVILLPEKKDGLAELEKQLSAERLASWIDALKEKEVAVSLPRFTASSQFSLAEKLSQMGMKKAFSGEADFSGISGARGLRISAVIHKAFIEVNEEGTEAAGATAVAVARGAAAPPEQFTADHPFLFVIRDTRSGAVLFFGRLQNPKA